MAEHVDSVHFVLTNFFEQGPEGYFSRRAEDEIQKFKDKQGNASKAGKASAKSRSNGRSTDVEQSSTNQNHNQNHNQISSSTKKNKTQPTQKPIGVSDEVWQSFSLIRKAKRAPITDLAMLGIRREAVKAGIELEQALTICCERGWAGFKAEWMQGHQGKPQAESFYERDKRAKRNEMAKWAPGIAARESEDFNTIEGNNHVIAIESD